jgi:hypothetical protein
LTSRERNLLILFLVALVSAGLVIGLGSYLEGLSRLDAEFVALQKRVLRATQSSLVSQSTWSSSSLNSLKERFFAPGTLPDPLALASRVQADLKAAGLLILESRVTDNSNKAHWVQYHAEGRIESWFRFLQLLRHQDPQTLFRSISLVKKQGSTYAIAFEVGHVVLP